jgi:hypothetical protein
MTWGTPDALAFQLPGVEDFFHIVLRIVVVVGGIILGWFITPPLVKLLVRLAFHRTVNPWVLTVCRLGGAVLVGYLAFLLPLGMGGRGPGPGGPGSGGVSSGQDKEKPAKDRKEKEPPRQTTDRASRDERSTLVVDMLGGNAVKAGRYYLVRVPGKSGKAEALTATELDGLLKKLTSGTKRIVQIDIRYYNNSVDETNKAVTKLKQLAEQYELRVKETNLDQDLPPP